MGTTQTTDSMLQLARGFMQSRVFITGAELDLYTLLASEALTAEAVRARINARLHGVTSLLNALTALSLLVKRDGRYQTEPSIAPFLSADSPVTILPMVLYSVALWRRWSKLTDIVLGNTEPETDNTDADEAMQTLVKAMHLVNSPKAPQVVADIAPGAARSLLDVGGGAGTYTLAFLQKAPQMQTTLFDFPSVIAIAQDQLHAAGMGERVRLVAGDYLTDDLPDGHDIALLSAVIHLHGPDENRILYDKVYQALKPGGRIVIRGFIMSEDQTEPMAGAMFSVNMLTSSLGGRTYSYSQIRDGLEQAGFTDVRLLDRQDGMFSLVDAFKPAFPG